MPFYRRIAFTILATYYTKRGPLIKYVQRSSLYFYLCIKTIDCPSRYLTISDSEMHHAYRQLEAPFYFTSVSPTVGILSTVGSRSPMQ